MTSLPVGAKVLVRELPMGMDSWPLESRAAFEFALGKHFVVAGIGHYGHLELELGPDADAALGGFMNSIWIEPELVEIVELAAPTAGRKRRAGRKP